MHIERNPHFIHHNNPRFIGIIREVVFGMEDGMVSTLGSIVGIAAATQERFTVILAGFVIISVESISMAVGSYISNKSERAIDERKLFEEKHELHTYPEEEKHELIAMYVKDGWTKPLAAKMAEEASKNKKLFLQEMAYRELRIFPDSLVDPSKNALFMGVSYIIGGSIPLVPYLFLPIQSAILPSILFTLLGLFILGATITKYTKRNWVKAGFEMLAIAGLAAVVGYAVGQLVDRTL